MVMQYLQIILHCDTRANGITWLLRFNASYSSLFLEMHSWSDYSQTWSSQSDKGAAQIWFPKPEMGTYIHNLKLNYANPGTYIFLSLNYTYFSISLMTELVCLCGLSMNISHLSFWYYLFGELLKDNMSTWTLRNIVTFTF